MVSSCAQISSPQGGPVDSLPPIILSTLPAPYTTNFKGKKVQIKFNEFIQLKDQQKFFTISPPGEKKPSLLVKGKTLEITFEEPLDSVTTYKLDFGNSIVDNNESNKLMNYSFIFSTGSVVDSLMMVGQVFDAFTRDSVIDAFLFYFDPAKEVVRDSVRWRGLDFLVRSRMFADTLFMMERDSLRRIDSLPGRGLDSLAIRRLDSLAVDSIIFSNKDRELDSMLFTGRPQALFRTDSSGYFVADILQEKPYRIYAVMDKNGNHTYDPGADMVGFIDGTFNPVDLGGFMVEIDSLSGRMTIDSLQVCFDVFKEAAIKRQTLLKHERPMRGKINLIFTAPHPRIDTLELEGIDSSWVIRESGVVGDTISLWISPPEKAIFDSLADTIRGRVVYQRHDSVWGYETYSQKLTLVNKKPVKDDKNKDKDKKSKRDLEKEQQDRRDLVADFIAKDSLSVDSLSVDSLLMDSVFMDSLTMSKKEKEPNPFKFNVNASQSLNPELGIGFVFDYPLVMLDSARVELLHLKKKERKGRAKKDEKVETTEEKVPAYFVQDTLNFRRWVLSAPWVEEDEYKLMIPDSVFRDIGFMVNDTLKQSFKIATASKFGSFVVKTQQDDSLSAKGYKYILELITGKGEQIKVVNRKVGVRPGDQVDFRFVAVGNYRMRITEDRNSNNKWDTGSLTHALQPEKVRMWRNKSTGDQILISKENWEVEMPTNLREIFEGQ